MSTLHQLISVEVKAWREAGYDGTNYGVIAEILEYQTDRETGLRRFLRAPQIFALEVYWYVRLVRKTPRILDLYLEMFPRKADLITALGVPRTAFEAVDYEVDVLWDRILTSDQFVKTYKLEALRETLALAYPSYILALAMGAGKTLLIAAIIAAEFAMAMEYPEGPFVKNALVFAPGKTILESLRQLADAPYEKILPPRKYKPFAANLKLTFTRDGDPDIPILRGSDFNVVVTNTEKIRIRKESIRKKDLGQLALPLAEEDTARAEAANRRLQAIASLPHLAVFSDEAHHTYGQSMGSDLKRVRQTVDYLAEASPNLVCVVNTTGTPYYQRQALKDVVVWYGLSQGIADGILKHVSGNIFGYSFDAAHTSDFVWEVLNNFFRDYRDVRLANGAPARLAMYFPQNDDLDQMRPVVETALCRLGLSPDLVLRNTSTSSQAEIDAFNRLGDPDAPHRVILLVNKGTEGWDCPSLFACALARKLKSSNNFVLQAATRCLRQIPGNVRPARIYLSMDNRSILDRQLRETYGETISDLEHTRRESRTVKITVRKLDLPPVVITRMVRMVVPVGDSRQPVSLELSKPEPDTDTGMTRRLFSIARQQATESVLAQVGATETIAITTPTLDLYSAAVEFSDIYRLPLWTVYDALKAVYGEAGELPVSHLDGLALQMEQAAQRYEVVQERVETALALVKPEGFTKECTNDGVEVYTAEIRYPVDREHLLLSHEDIAHNPGGYGFHYTPYNFDSNPEKSFYEQILNALNLQPSDVEDILFTGAVTDPAKSDFFVEYKDEVGGWRRYVPDFIIRKTGDPGRYLIVEIKREHDRFHPVDGYEGRKAMALRKLEGLNPERLKYEMIFTDGDQVSADQVRLVTSLFGDARKGNSE